MTPAQFPRALYHIIKYHVLKAYRFIVRPALRGVGCIVEHKGNFLLIKTVYGGGAWSIPGGYVEGGESFAGAAIREVKEETDVDVEGLVKIGGYENTIGRKHDTIEVYYGTTQNPAFKIDPFEIREAGWFARNELPVNRVPRVDEQFAYLDLFQAQTK